MSPNRRRVRCFCRSPIHDISTLRPVFVGKFLGVQTLGGLLGGAPVTGVMMAIFTSNAGGAWGTGNFDNDTACDWVGEVYDSEGAYGLSLVESTLDVTVHGGARAPGGPPRPFLATIRRFGSLDLGSDDHPNPT
ncbi:MAG: DUF4259 domain-containing protein [bacterium]|nr:DUF4259 domain-containing protein [bacterium]